MLMQSSEWPVDIIGVILEFLDSRLPVLYRYAFISTRWWQAFDTHEPIWTTQMRLRWPRLSKHRQMNKEMFKRRLLLDRKGTPVPPAWLTDIENCGFEFAFRCPLVAEMLKESGQVDEKGDPTLYCSVCNEHVYLAKSTDELRELVQRKRCVRFTRNIERSGAIVPPDLTLFLLTGAVPRAHLATGWIVNAAQPHFPQMRSTTVHPLRFSLGQSCYSVNPIVEVLIVEVPQVPQPFVSEGLTGVYQRDPLLEVMKRCIDQVVTKSGASAIIVDLPSGTSVTSVNAFAAGEQAVWKRNLELFAAAGAQTKESHTAFICDFEDPKHSRKVVAVDHCSKQKVNEFQSLVAFLRETFLVLDVEEGEWTAGIMVDVDDGE